MAIIEFDVALFREQFPEFASETDYPDATLQMYWNMATCYISDEDFGCLKGDCRRDALNMLTAHIARLYSQVSDGSDPGFVASATIDKVSVSRWTPDYINQWNYWLSQTPYGQMLLALLSATGVGGLYIGGINERSAFRQNGGVYIPD